MCELAAVSQSLSRKTRKNPDLNTHCSRTDCHGVDFGNPAIRLQVWGQTDPITRIRAVWSHKQKPCAKLNAWLRPAHQTFCLVNKQLVYYFKCNVLLLLYKNSSAKIFRTGKQETWTKVTLQWPGLYSWGVLWRSWERAETLPSLVPTRRRGKRLAWPLSSCGMFSTEQSQVRCLVLF